jgi:hypothetical protein
MRCWVQWCLQIIESCATRFTDEEVRWLMLRIPEGFTFRQISNELGWSIALQVDSLLGVIAEHLGTGEVPGEAPLGEGAEEAKGGEGEEGGMPTDPEDPGAVMEEDYVAYREGAVDEADRDDD